MPTRFGHREVLVKGFVDAVVICHGAEVIARHVRSYQAADFVFDPLHYLALLERKTGALDQAAPLQDWDLPPEFATLRRLLEARMEKRGRREFVQVLRLMEVFRAEDVTAAVRGRAVAGRDQLRCGQAPGAVPDREAGAPARSVGLSVLARGHGKDDESRRLRHPHDRGTGMTASPQVLLAHHLKQLKLPTFLREYDKLARQCAADGVDHPRYLLRLAELELLDRE